MSYQPPFEITPKIVNQISSIAEQVGRLDTQSLKVSPQLRKQNRIKTIQSTLAIEGNTLDLFKNKKIAQGSLLPATAGWNLDILLPQPY